MRAHLDDGAVPGERALALITTSPEGKEDQHYIPLSVLAERMELLGVDEQEALRVIVEDEPLLGQENPYIEPWQALLQRKPAEERRAAQAAARASMARPGLNIAASRAPFNPIVQTLLDALTPGALEEGRQRFNSNVRSITNGEVDLDAK